MSKLSMIGRIFYGLAISGLGFLEIYYKDFPYMLIPPKHDWIPGLEILNYLTGALLILAGAGIVFGKKTRTISLILGGVLALIFCLYFLPYQLIVSTKYMYFGDWENAAK